MMKKPDPKLESKAMSQTPENNTNGRRKLLKKASTVGAVATVAVWTKPTLYSVVTPAHAQTSADPAVPPATMVVLAGATTLDPLSPKLANQGGNDSTSVASKMLDALIPDAHAGIAAPASDICGAFTVNGPDDYTHCVEVTLEDAAENAGFSLTITGPTVYYDFYSHSGGYAFYCGKANFSGTETGTLTGRDIAITVGGAQFIGAVADDFQSVSGTVSSLKTFSSVGSGDGGSYATCDPGSTANWNAGTVGACTPGAGANERAGGYSLAVSTSCF